MKKVDTTFLIVILAELIMTGYWYLMISTLPSIEGVGLRFVVDNVMSRVPTTIGIAILVFWWLLGVLITTIVVYVIIRWSMWLKNR